MGYGFQTSFFFGIALSLVIKRVVSELLYSVKVSIDHISHTEQGPGTVF
jgi:hypothetical protein